MRVQDPGHSYILQDVSHDGKEDTGLGQVLDSEDRRIETELLFRKYYES